MTANKLANNAKEQISDDDFVYTFHPDEFDEFCKQLCKEQRHICQIEMDKDSVQLDGKWYVSCKDILTTNIPNYK